MSNTLKLIERMRSTTETGTNYAIAKALSMDPSNLNRILKGRAFPGQKAQMRMAETLQIDLRDIVALINEDKAQSEEDRSYWRSVCAPAIRALLDAAPTLAASLAMLAVLSSAPQAGTWVSQKMNDNVYIIHYAKCIAFFKRMCLDASAALWRIFWSEINVKKRGFALGRFALLGVPLRGNTLMIAR